MSDVSLSKAVRSNLLSLQNTSAMMAKTQDRLASGNKVNSALDNPTNFFTAQGLNSRAGDLNQLMDGMANGIQTLEAADNGLTAITKTLESMQSTLRQARQDKSFQTTSYTLPKINANDPTLGKLVFSGGAVGNPTEIALTKTGTGGKVSTTASFETPTAAAAASFAGDVANDDAAAVAGATFSVTFGGDTVTFALAADADNTLVDWEAQIADTLADSDLAGIIEFDSTGGKFTFSTAENIDGAITVGGADADAVFGTEPVDPEDIQAGEFTATDGSNGQHSFTINNKEVTIEAGDSLADAVTAINTQLGEKSKFEAFADGNKLGLRALESGAGPLVVGGDNAALFGSPTAGNVTAAQATDLTFARSVDELVTAVNTALDGKVKASNDNGKLRLENQSTQQLDLEGINATGGIDGVAAGETKIDGNSVRAGLANQFNELRDQLDKLADDASFNGINLLRGDKLSITFNETGTSSIDIQSKGEEAVNSTNLGVSTTLTEQDMDTDSNIDTELSTLKLALNEVRSQSSAFGSNLSIVQNRQDFTKNMINTLQTGAANLTLADMNEEAANLLALQTRQSLSSSSLSLASQADQSVLQLIR